MSRGVYYMLQFADTQSNLSAPGHIEFYYFVQSFLDHKYFSVCVCVYSILMSFQGGKNVIT